MAIKKYHVSINKFNIADTVSNTFIRAANTSSSSPLGSEVSNQTFDCSDFVAVNASTKYSIKYPEYQSAQGAGLVYFTADKTSISGITTAGQGGAFYTFSTPQNCAYIRFSWKNTNGDNVMLVEGEYTEQTMPPYEPYGGTWNEVGYKKYGTETETFSSLPHEVIGDGTAISAWSLKGNMAQSGTPTPSNPVYPQEVGEKTANLFNYETMSDGGSGYLKSDGTITSSSTWNYTDYIPCNGTNFVLSKVGGGSAAICFYDNTKEFIYGQAYQTGGAGTLADIICTVPQTAKYIRFTYANSSQGSPAIDLSTIMLSENTAAVNFEPYGYKIPISFNQTTYNIYITEPLRKSLDGSNVYDELSSNGTLTRRVDENGDALATPTTEQVTVPTLTTTGTPEQFNVLTTLAPSEVSLTYHGWHEHQDTKYSNP